MRVGTAAVKKQEMRSGAARREAHRTVMGLARWIALGSALAAVSCGSSDSVPPAAGGAATSGAGAGAETSAGGAGGGAETTSGAGGAGTTSGTGGDANPASGTGGDANPASGTGGGAGTSSGAGGATAGTGGELSNAGTAGSVSADGYSLLFRDDFDALDLTRWQLMTHSWEGNLALFSASAVTVEAGELRVALTPAPVGTVDSGVEKSFFGAEVRSVQTVNYGRVRARMRFARGSAVVSSLVTIYTPWPADNWNELDIECLGKDPTHTQFNAMVYTGPPVTPPATTSVTPTQEPELVELGFDPSADFHVYTIEWTPTGARFLVDEVVRHTWNTRIELMACHRTC